MVAHITKSAPWNLFCAFSAPGRTHSQKWPQEAHSEHFQPLAAHMAKSSFGSSLYAFSALGRTYAPGSSFWAFSTNGRTYSQKQPQEAYFDSFRPLAAQVAKSSSRKLLTSNTAREICVKLNTAREIVLKLNTTWKIELAPKKQWGWNEQHPATLAACMAKSSPRKFILSIFNQWLHI